ETIRRIRGKLAARAVSAELALQHPDAIIHHDVQVWARQPEATLSEWQQNHPGGHGAKFLDNHVWLQVSDIDVLALEPNPSGGKLRVLHMGEVKTGAHDSATEARTQLDNNINAMLHAAGGGTPVRLEIGGADIAPDIDLGSAGKEVSATYGPSRPPGGSKDE